MRVPVLLVLVLGLGAFCLAEGEGKVEFQVQDETCSDYCAPSYPEHTYPEVRSLYVSLLPCSISLFSPHSLMTTVRVPEAVVWPSWTL